MTQQISAVGTIATEPKLFTPQGGAPFCTFRIASTDRRFDPQSSTWIDGDTNWFTVNSFRSLALNANQSFSKGDRVIVSGRLRVRSWESDERRGISIEIDADGIGHDVRWGTSSFVRGPKPAEQVSEHERGEQHEQGADTQSTDPQGADPVSAAAKAPQNKASEVSEDGFTPKVGAA